MEKPLVSICMLTYRQEHYVREAIRSVFSQTYEPLEILISDDSSPDRTWDIICEEVAEYKRTDGRHRVILNRNVKNLGIALHYERAREMMHGVIQVLNAGDDVSMPTRVERIVKAWIDDGCRATVVHHSGWNVDTQGRRIGSMRLSNNDQPLGAAMAYVDVNAFDFPPIGVRGASEDVIYTARAEMRGPQLIIDDKLMYYRVGSGVSSVLSEQRGPALRGYIGWAKAYEQVYKDLEAYRGNVSGARYVELKARYDAYRRYANGYVKLIGGKTFRERLSGYRIVRDKAVISKRKILQVLYLLPTSVGDIFLNSGTVVKNLIQRSFFKVMD